MSQGQVTSVVGVEWRTSQPPVVKEAMVEQAEAAAQFGVQVD
jgi:hypothetical protein